METEVKKEASTSKKLCRGIVTGCHLLNLRTSPNEDSKVGAILPALTEVLVDSDYSNKTYYRVIVPVLMHHKLFGDFPFDKYYHGYCMKNFISIK